MSKKPKITEKDIDFEAEYIFGDIEVFELADKYFEWDDYGFCHEITPYSLINFVVEIEKAHIRRKYGL
jgi:hypothetical protein